jgi:hypothetical protein
MTAREHVALVHEGRVLTDGAGHLPELAWDGDDDALFGAALDAVGGEVYLAPVLRLGPGRHVHVVGIRSGRVPAGSWVEPATVAGGLGDQVHRAWEEHVGEAPTRRPAWFAPGWYDEVEQWVDQVLDAAGRRRTGPPRVVRVWSLSAVLRVPTTDGEVWFKAACDHFRGEPAVHRVVAEHLPEVVPELVGVDEGRGWLLMEPLRGAGDANRAEGAEAALARTWARTQIASLGFRDALVAAGARRRDAGDTVAAWRRVLTDSPEPDRLTEEERRRLVEADEEVAALVHALWACGFPDTLAHGDLHLGNVAWDGRALRVFDWTDGCVSHPFLDGSHLACFDDRRPVDPALLRAFVDPWRSAWPGADVDRAGTLAPAVDLVFQVATFDQIRAATEEASQWELGDVVPHLLRRIPAAVRAVAPR